VAVKSDAQDWTIKEQIIDDPVTGLTFQFEKLPTGEFAFRVFGPDLPFGNREFSFSRQGAKTGSGVFVSGLCRPAWLTSLD
jgi:hypothetical protein